MRFYRKDENDARRETAREFQLVFELVLMGESVDLYKENFGALLSSVADELLGEKDEHGFWQSQSFYGINNISAQVLNTNEVEFQDKVAWMGEFHYVWQDLRLRVLDRGTNQRDLWITLWIDEMKAEGDLRTAFGVIRDRIDDEV